MKKMINQTKNILLQKFRKAKQLEEGGVYSAVSYKKE